MLPWPCSPTPITNETKTANQSHERAHDAHMGGADAPSLRRRTTDTASTGTLASPPMSSNSCLPHNNAKTFDAWTDTPLPTPPAFLFGPPGVEPAAPFRSTGTTCSACCLAFVSTQDHQRTEAPHILHTARQSNAGSSCLCYAPCVGEREKGFSLHHTDPATSVPRRRPL